MLAKWSFQHNNILCVVYCACSIIFILYHFRSPCIRESVDSLYRDGTGEISRDQHTKRKLGENHSLGLQNKRAIVYGSISTYTYSQRPHKRLQSSTREFDFRLLSGTSWSADFFTERLQFRRRCARTSSDRFFLAASHYGRSWSSSMVDTEQRHLLLTQHMRQAGALSNAQASWPTCRGTLSLQCLL